MHNTHSPLSPKRGQSTDQVPETEARFRVRRTPGDEPDPVNQPSTSSKPATAIESPQETSYHDYEMPEALRESILAQSYELTGLNSRYAAISLSSRDTKSSEMYDKTRKRFFALRKQLREDAAQYFAERKGESLRPDLPPLNRNGSPSDTLHTLLGLRDGLVLGEVHSDTSSKQLLIENMASLYQRGVRTLYLEHIPSDGLQKALDEYAASKLRSMPKALLAYLQHQNGGQRVAEESPYNFVTLVEAARKHGVRVVAIDCFASYFLKELGTHERLEMMNFYAEKVIKQYQSRPGAGKWLALVGNIHSNRTLGVPGLAELTQSIGLRIDPGVLEGPSFFQYDEGFGQSPSLGESNIVAWVQADYALTNAAFSGHNEDELRARLGRGRHYLSRVDPLSGRREIWVRAGSQGIVVYAIGQSGGRFHIVPAEGQTNPLAQRDYPSMAQLCEDLEQRWLLTRINSGPESPAQHDTVSYRRAAKAKHDTAGDTPGAHEEGEAHAVLTPAEREAALIRATHLPKNVMFLRVIQLESGERQLWHRLERDSTEATPILQDSDGQFYLDIPQWKSRRLHLTRYASLILLCEDLFDTFNLPVLPILSLPLAPNESQREATMLLNVEYAKRVPLVGQFLIFPDPVSADLTLVRRVSREEVIIAPIRQEPDGRFYIDSPAFDSTPVHQVRYDGVKSLSDALVQHVGIEPVDQDNPYKLPVKLKSTAPRSEDPALARYVRARNALLLQLSVFATEQERAEFRAGKKNADRELAGLGLEDAELASLQGYFAEAARRLSPRQQGGVLQAIHQRQSQLRQEATREWEQQVAELGGVNLKPIQHNLYLAAAERQQGVCAGLSTQLASSWLRDLIGEGPSAAPQSRSHIDHYLQQLTDATHDPDSPSARIFGLGLLEWSFKPEDARFDTQARTESSIPLSHVVALLSNAESPAAFELSAGTHAIMLGSAIQQGQRTFSLADPNFGYAEFASRDAFLRGLEWQMQHWPTGPGVSRVTLRRYRSDLPTQPLLARRDKKFRGPADLLLSDLSEGQSLAERFNSGMPLEQDTFFIQQQNRLTVAEYRIQLLDRQSKQGGVALTPLLSELLARHQVPSRSLSSDTRLVDITFGKTDAYVWLHDDIGLPLPRYTISGGSHPEDVAFLRRYREFTRQLEGQTSILSRLFKRRPALGLDTVYLASALPENGQMAAGVGVMQAITADIVTTLEPVLPTREDEHRLQLADQQLRAESMAERLQQSVHAMLAGVENPEQWIPILPSFGAEEGGGFRMTFRHRLDPRQSLERSSHDPALGEVVRYLDQTQTTIRRGTEQLLVNDVHAIDGLNSAFAIQALLRWLTGRDRAGTTSDDPGVNRNLVLAVQIHDYVNSAQIGQGILMDGVSMAQLIKTAAHAEAAPLQGASSALLAKAGVALQLGSMGLDIYELTQADSERQKAVFGTHLAFDSAGLGLGIAGFAGVGVAGPAGVLLAGLGVGISGLVDAYSAVAEHAAAVGAYFYRFREAYTVAHDDNSGGYRYDPEHRGLLPMPGAVFRQLDLTQGQVLFDSPWLYASKHGRTGSGKINYFLWVGDMPQMVHRREYAFDIRQRLGYAEHAALPASGWRTADVVHLPATPKHYITFAYNTLPGATSRHDAGFDVLRQMEGDDFDFDFYIFPSERIIDRLGFEYVRTDIDILLGGQSRRLQMPKLENKVQGVLHYHLKADRGQFVIGLMPGASVSLATTDAQQTRWTLDARNLSDSRVEFTGQGFRCGGIEVEIDAGVAVGALVVLCQNGDVMELDVKTKATRVQSVDAHDWPKDTQALSEHLHQLSRQHLLDERFVPISHFPVKDANGVVEREIEHAYYDQQYQDYLYIEPRFDYPEASLVTRQGNAAYFFNRRDRTKLLKVEADTHRLLASYQLAGEKPLQVWLENQHVLLDAGQRNTARNAVYRITEEGLVLERLRADAALTDLLQQTSRIDDVASVLKPYLDGVVCVSEQAETAQLPTQGMVVVDRVNAEQLRQRYWLRMQDGVVIKPRFEAPSGTPRVSLPADMSLVGNAPLPDGREVLYFFSQQEKQVYRQIGFAPEGEFTALRMAIAGLVSLSSRDGLLYVETEDGLLHHLDMPGKLTLMAVTGRWIKAHPRWWQSLTDLPGATTLSVLDIKRPDGGSLPVWLMDGNIITAAPGLPSTVELMGVDETQHAWLYDRHSASLYRQSLPTEAQLARAFDAQGMLNDADALPVAEPAPGVDSLRLLDTTLTWVAGSGTLPPLLSGIRQLLLAPKTATPVTISAENYEHYQSIVVVADPQRQAGDNGSVLEIKLVVPVPLALEARREGDDLVMFDRSTGKTVTLKQAFAAGEEGRMMLSIALGNGLHMTFPPLSLPAAEGDDATELRWMARESLM